MWGIACSFKQARLRLFPTEFYLMQLQDAGDASLYGNDTKLLKNIGVLASVKTGHHTCGRSRTHRLPQHKGQLYLR